MLSCLGLSSSYLLLRNAFDFSLKLEKRKDMALKGLKVSV